MDAANVDLKGFTEDFYWKLADGHLEPVLDTLRWLVHESQVWVEITNLVIPAAMIARGAGADVPVDRQGIGAGRAGPFHGLPPRLSS